MENLSKRDGKAIVDFGYYDPMKKTLDLDKDLLFKYLNVGAYPTDTMRHLISRMLEQKE
jgi:small subunit ribosomal protein S16